MAIEYPAILDHPLPSVLSAYSARDTMRYALSIGLGSDPLDLSQLPFVCGPQLRSFPTMALSLGYVPLRDMGLGIDYGRMVQGGQDLLMHHPLPVHGEVSAQHRLVDVTDLGATRGALLRYERELRDAANGRLLVTAVMTAFCRGDGGFGGPVSTAPRPLSMPTRAPDAQLELSTFAQQALLYRLAGDLAPIHADPQTARQAGFERPLLQGIATFGMVARAVIACCAGGDETQLRRLGGRFSNPIYPGETLVVQIWRSAENEALVLRAMCKERGTVVFDNAHATIGAQPVESNDHRA